MRLETVYLEVAAAALPEVAAFYRDVLGLALSSEEADESVWFDAGSLRLGFHVAEAGVANPDAVSLSFDVPDVNAERDRLLGLGLQVTEAWDAPWGARVATLRDPAGHTVWISTPL